MVFQKIVLLIGVVALFGCSDINKVMKSTDYEYKIKKANEYYEAKKYSKAQLVYEDVMPVVKGTPDYESLYYRWAYCNYYQKDYLNAESLFRGFGENFPKSSKADEMEFMRAYSHYKISPKAELDQTSTLKAITFLQTYINIHPNSPKAKEATELIEVLRKKLEVKDVRSATLYYDMGMFKAAATAFNEIMFNFPDSDKGDEYKLMMIKAWFKYAENSYEYKQVERFEKVLNECADFVDRFPESKLLVEANKYKGLSENKIKTLQNEQIKASTER